MEVTDENYKYLEFLDALKDWKKIPDLDKKSCIEILTNILKKFNKKQTEELLNIALSYPPRVRAFLGALLEYSKKKINLNCLEESLNPLSEYKLGISKDIVPTIKKWDIK